MTGDEYELEKELEEPVELDELELEKYVEFVVREVRKGSKQLTIVVKDFYKLV